MKGRRGGESMDNIRKNLKELEDLARPLADYLKKRHHPHTAVVVTSEHVDLWEETMGAPVKRGDGR